MRYCIDCKYKYTRFDESPCKECKRLDHFEKGNAEVQILELIKSDLKAESDFTGAGHLVVEWETIEKVIDERIAELKGE